MVPWLEMTLPRMRVKKVLSQGKYFRFLLPGKNCHHYIGKRGEMVSVLGVREAVVLGFFPVWRWCMMGWPDGNRQLMPLQSISAAQSQPQPMPAVGKPKALPHPYCWHHGRDSGSLGLEMVVSSVPVFPVTPVISWGPSSITHCPGLLSLWKDRDICSSTGQAAPFLLYCCLIHEGNEAFSPKCLVAS